MAAVFFTAIVPAYSTSLKGNKLSFGAPSEIVQPGSGVGKQHSAHTVPSYDVLFNGP